MGDSFKTKMKPKTTKELTEQLEELLKRVESLEKYKEVTEYKNKGVLNSEHGNKKDESINVNVNVRNCLIIKIK